MITRIKVIASLIILCPVLVGLAGCAPASTQPVEQPTVQSTPPAVTSAAGLPSGWETYTGQGQCSYAISHPSDIDVTSQGTYNVLLSPTSTEPSGPVPSFIYISVIPDDIQNVEPGSIYNYDPAETQTLLSMQPGESKSLRDDPNLAPSFTYTRLPDTMLSNQTAQTYENTQPWEFPPGTKEIRYYLKANGCTYLIGGYLAGVDSGGPMGIDEETFDQIINTFRIAP